MKNSLFRRSLDNVTVVIIAFTGFKRALDRINKGDAHQRTQTEIYPAQKSQQVSSSYLKQKSRKSSSLVSSSVRENSTSSHQYQRYRDSITTSQNRYSSSKPKHNSTTSDSKQKALNMMIPQNKHSSSQSRTIESSRNGKLKQYTSSDHVKGEKGKISPDERKAKGLKETEQNKYKRAQFSSYDFRR